MKFNPKNKFLVYGDLAFRGKCPSETIEQITFFNRIRAQYPKSYGIIATHIRNEGKRHHGATTKAKAEGMTKGASDIIIPGRISFVCEMKRRDHTKCRFQEGQEDYLNASHSAGAFVCVALGVDAAWEALQHWILEIEDVK
jgi:hypothetical protein